jgi:succinylglutamate desuccinylase
MYALAEASERVSIREIGRTHEHRPLLMLTITSVENHSNIEQLRKEHVARIEAGKPVPSNTPLFINMGYSIHGNEPSGVFALKNVFDEIVNHNIQLNGSLLAFVGNRNALNAGQRYATIDLNRLWTDENQKKLKSGGFSAKQLNPDVLEMIAINELIHDFQNMASGKEHYFIDLHTTSAPSVPFAVVDRNPQCIEMALRFPLPVIVNLNEHIKGTMLNYLDKREFQGLVFEAGQHEDLMSIVKHEAIIWMSLVESGALEKKYEPDYNAQFELLNGLSDDPHKLFEIVHREGINDNDVFEMKPGFVNFQAIEKGEHLGWKNDQKIISQHTGRIFMPLYQSKGTDGFFIVKRIS